MERRAILALRDINPYLKRDGGRLYDESGKAIAKQILCGGPLPERLAAAIIELVAAIDEEARRPERAPCDECCGTGYFAHPQMNCTTCRGTGYVMREPAPMF